MTESLFEYVDDNLKRMQAAIGQAAVQAGRLPQDITLLAATKTVSPRLVNYAITRGVTAIGENRVQELLEKYPALQLQNCDCQFIGRLQSNKIKYIVPLVSQIQSIDNMGQIQELAKQLKKTNRCMKVLIEVNIGKEENKGGVHKDCLYEFVDEARKYREIHINGLMAIPPVVDEVRELRCYFSQMQKYFVDIQGKKMDNVNMNILSMGMSNDFKEAIACGANMVRVGSALFGKR